MLWDEHIPYKVVMYNSYDVPKQVEGERSGALLTLVLEAVFPSTLIRVTIHVSVSGRMRIETTTSPVILLRVSVHSDPAKCSFDTAHTCLCMNSYIDSSFSLMSFASNRCSLPSSRSYLTSCPSPTITPTTSSACSMPTSRSAVP